MGMENGVSIPQTRSTIPCNYDAKIIVCAILCLLNLGVEDMMLSH